MDKCVFRPRTSLIATYICILFVFLLTACSGGTSSSSTPSAQQLIKDAQAAIQKVTAYHFNLVADNPGAGGLLAIKSADGDTVVPDKLQADANALALGNVVKIKIIAINGQQYITDPITGAWTKTSNLLDPRSLSDSNTGIAAILGHIENPSTPIDSNVDGTPCWSIDGQLDAKYLTAITGGGTPTGTKVKTTICIGKSDKLPYLIRMNGQVVQGDTDKTTRTFKLSKFNENVTITAPI